MGLRGADVHHSPDEHGILLDAHAPPERVDVLHPQSGRFTPPEPGVGQEEDQHGVRGCGGESFDLLVREVRLRLRHLRRGPFMVPIQWPDAWTVTDRAMGRSEAAVAPAATCL